MDLRNAWREWKASTRLQKSLNLLLSGVVLTAENTVASPLSSLVSPSPNGNPSPRNQLSSIGDHLCLDHISSVAPSGGRMVVASGRPLRHMDWETGKHFILEPAGIRLESWMANPQVWWKHNSNIPLGTSDLVLEDGRLVADNIRFHRQRIPVAGWDLGEFDTGVVADLYEAGVLRASSVQVFFTMDDLRRMFETKEHVIIPSSELVEWSLVTAPADREAVRLSLEGFGLDNKLTALLIGEQIRENNSRPVEVVSPAPTENVMENQDELELDESVVEAIALETAPRLSNSAEFVAAIVAAVVADPAFTEALRNAIAAASPPAPEPVPAIVAETAPRVTRLVVAKREPVATNGHTPTVAAAAPVAAPVTQYVNPANKPTMRHQLLAQMTSKPRR